MVLTFDFHLKTLKKNSKSYPSCHWYLASQNTLTRSSWKATGGKPRVIDTFEYEGQMLFFKPFQANVPILHPLKTSGNQSFSVFSGYKMETAINRLNFWHNIYRKIITWNSTIWSIFCLWLSSWNKIKLLQIWWPLTRFFPILHFCTL